jgi:hypothetical protein
MRSSLVERFLVVPAAELRTWRRAVGRSARWPRSAHTIQALQALPGDLHHDATDDTWMIKVQDVAVINFQLDGAGTNGTHVVRVLSVTDPPAERKRR